MRRSPSTLREDHDGLATASTGNVSPAGRGVGDVAAEGAAVLDLRAADDARGLDEHRKAAAHERRGDELGVGGESAQDEGLAAQANPSERAQALEVEEALLRDGAEVEAHVEVGAARQRHERPLVAQHPKRLVEGREAEER